MRWTLERKRQLVHLWGEYNGSASKVARHMNVTRAAIIGKTRTLGLQHHARGPIPLAEDHRAAQGAHTRYPYWVRDPDLNVLKSAANQRKIGPKVTKGRWKTFRSTR